MIKVYELYRISFAKGYLHIHCQQFHAIIQAGAINQTNTVDDVNVMMSNEMF